MSLFIPKDPKEIRNWIRKLEEMNSPTSTINWDSFHVWYGNRLPKYLWSEWKNTLKPAGFTWQRFLKLLSRRTDAVLMWYKGAYTWDQFVKETIKLIEGPLGQDLAKKK